MEKEGLLIDPKWISSFYALVATAVCTLIFTYKGVDFIDAFIKTFFTVISFYIFGLVTAAAINFYYMNFVKKHESTEEKEKEQTKDESEEEIQQQEVEQQV